MNIKTPLNERYYLIEWFLLITGTATGLALAWILVGFQWSIPGELERSRTLGMVSLTTLSDYAKSRDMFNYIFTLVLPVIGALIFWHFRPGSSNLGGNTLADSFSPPATRVWRYIILVPLITGFLSWHLSTMLIAGWNPDFGSWVFLGERGATLAWVQSITDGGVYGRDFFSLYGPMFIYPLYWLMNLLGNVAYMESIYKWGLDIIAFGLLGFILIRTMRSRLLALLLIIIIFLLFPAQQITTANATILRYIIGIFPIVCAALWIDTRQTKWFWIGGLVAGQALLFSQESGACSISAIITIFILNSLGKDKAVPLMLRTISKFIIIVLLSMAPMMIFLILNGAFQGFLDCILGYPQMVTLGFNNIPFPSLRNWLGRYFIESWLHYAVISIYCASIITLFVSWFRKVRSARFFWTAGLVIYGVLLFRVALGRSGDVQTMKAMIPALILSAVWVDELWMTLRQNHNTHLQKAILWVSLTAILINFTNGICMNQTAGNFLVSSLQETFKMDGKFSIVQGGETMVPERRLGMYVDEFTAISINEIKSFIEQHTRKGEYVYFFPNEAAYYFLFDRKNPTRYPVAYFAATYERQDEVIHDLEKNKPRYVVYSKQTWRIDGIYEQVQIPKIVNYLNRHYKIVKPMQSVDIFKRIPEEEIY
jgi:hypothetical protein